MCGIFCEVCYTGSSINLEQNEKIYERIKHRGPNCSQIVKVNSIPNTTITLCGAVLWMQGPEVTPQPMENNKGILLYNGDIFDEKWSSDVSDTQTIMDMLSQQNEISTDSHIIESLKLLKGPFSLLYYEKKSKNIFFSRDRIGRSTMLMSKNEDRIIISSVLDRKYQCVEIPATHLYSLNIENQKLTLYPWDDASEISQQDLVDWLNNIQYQQGLPDDEFQFKIDNNLDFIDKDYTVEFIESTGKSSTCKLTLMENLLSNAIIKDTVQEVKELLEKSVKIRLKRQPNRCINCLSNEEILCNHCTVGILFSGGLDCTVLAVLADTFLPKEQQIDLINVAFKKDEGGTYEVPDRLTGRQSYEELKILRPKRKWNFIEINIPKKELDEFQESTIADLVYPRQTILDESLGSALWFAARGKYECGISTCRVLLLGSGADELFGGYTRHRNAYKRRGWTGLAMELLLDWKRISFRNLARDNRVLCDHGRQPRMPYLDEDFTDFVLNLQPWLKCFPSESLGPGIGDKLMLRLVAYRLGLKYAAILPKRALQFGSRIANKKEKGSDISKRFCK